MKYLYSKLFWVILLVITLLLFGETEEKTYKSSSYKSTSSSSNKSGSGGSTKWAMSTENWILIVVFTIVGFAVIIFGILFCCLCRCKAKKVTETEKAKALQLKQENDAILRNKQMEEATKLEKIQLEMEEKESDNKFWEMESSLSMSTMNFDQSNILIFPGQSIQPKYVDVNPYSGHYNNSVVPVVYDLNKIVNPAVYSPK